MLETVTYIAKNRGRLSEVCQDGRLIWLPQPNSCLVELPSIAECWLGELSRGMFVVLETGGVESAAKGTVLVESLVLKGGVTLFLVFGM